MGLFDIFMTTKAQDQALALGQQRNQMEMSQFAEQQSERHQKEADAGKAAEYFFKANPAALGELGESPDSFKNRSAGDKYAAMLAYGQQQLQKQNTARAADLDAQATQRMTAERDANVFKTVLQSYGQPTAVAPALDGETDTDYGNLPVSAPKLDPKDFLMKFFQAGGSPRGGEWASQALKNIMGDSEDGGVTEGTTKAGIPWAMHRKTIQFFPQVNAESQGPKEDPTGKFYWNGKSWQAKKEAPDPGAAPITSPDGKFYWSGSRWVNVKEDPSAALLGLMGRGKTNAPAAAPAATKTGTSSAQQAILDDFKAGKLSREAAKVKLQALGLD